MADSFIRYERKGKAAVVTMDDGKVNALGEQMLRELDGALSRAEEEASSLLLVGRPGRFCAGFDLKTMMSGIKAATELLTIGGELLLRLYASPLPIVAACTGHAMAGGALLLLSIDTRIGATGAFKIGLNEVSIGMPLPVLAQEFARDRLDPRRLTEAALQAKVYDPVGAVEVGFLDVAIDPESLMERAFADAERLAALPRKPYAWSKARLRQATIERIRAADGAELEAFGG